MSADRYLVQDLTRRDHQDILPDLEDTETPAVTATNIAQIDTSSISAYDDFNVGGPYSPGPFLPSQDGINVNAAWDGCYSHFEPRLPLQVHNNIDVSNPGRAGSGLQSVQLQPLGLQTPSEHLGHATQDWTHEGYDALPFFSSTQPIAREEHITHTDAGILSNFYHDTDISSESLYDNGSVLPTPRPFVDDHSGNANIELGNSPQTSLPFLVPQEASNEPSYNEAAFPAYVEHYDQPLQPDGLATDRFSEAEPLLNFDDYLEDLALFQPMRRVHGFNAVLLGIPEDNRTENPALQNNSSANTFTPHESLSEEHLEPDNAQSAASPATLRSIQTISSATLQSPSSISSPSEGDTNDVLTLLPPPPGFSHTKMVVSLPILPKSKTIEKAWKEASDAEIQGENRLAYALPGLASVSGLQNVNSKRLRSPVESTAEPGNTQDDVVDQLKTGRLDVQPVEAISANVAAPRKKRGKLNDQRRVEVAEIRKLGACLRCGIHKMKCSKDLPCDRCLMLAKSSKMTLDIPCWRSKLSNIELYRRRTQQGLFVYTYTKAGQDILGTRTVRIIDPGSLETSEQVNSPISFREAISMNSGSVLQSLSRHIVLPRSQDGSYVPYSCTIAQLNKGHVISKYLDIQMKSVLQTLGTSHQFVGLTLDIAEKYSSMEKRQLLRNSLRIFTARFLRRKFWVSKPDDTNYDAAWMDVPWRALPVQPPKTSEEADELNQILKEYLYSLERRIVREFKAKIYDRKREDWFELFLVTFIFQVVLSEKLEMSFYYDVEGVDQPLEMPWSTFGGLRSYSSQEIAAHFRAINGSKPFHMREKERAELGELGALETSYLSECPNLLKESLRNKNDLGSRRSSSSGHDGTPGSWWQWALDTILNTDVPD